MTERLELINVHAIDIGEQQVRDTPHDDDIEELALDIQANGLLQPIGVFQLKGSRYQLRFGSRRLAAHKHLGRATIAALVSDEKPSAIKSTAVRENIHRRAMTLKEECDAVAYLHDVEKKSPNEIRAIMGKGLAWVQSRLLLPTMPIDLQDAVLDARLPISHAELLMQVEDPGQRAQLLQHCQNEHWTVPLLRHAITHLSDYDNVSDAIAAGVAAAHTPQAAIIIRAECHICRTARLLNELLTIKVCADGCTPTVNAQPSTDAGQASNKPGKVGNPGRRKQRQKVQHGDHPKH